MQFVICTCLALEGHGLWVPTSLYEDIVTRGVVPRGAKSSAFTVPSDHWDGCHSIPGLISIQAAYVCPEWTWIFVDHNVLLTFHIMALRQVCTKEDLKPESDVMQFHPSSVFFFKKKLKIIVLALVFSMERNSWP